MPRHYYANPWGAVGAGLHDIGRYLGEKRRAGEQEERIAEARTRYGEGLERLDFLTPGQREALGAGVEPSIAVPGPTAIAKPGPYSEEARKFYETRRLFDIEHPLPTKTAPTKGPAPSVNQAMELLKDQYVITDEAGEFAGYSLPESQMYDMALEMAGGGPMSPKIAPTGGDIVPPEFDPTSPIPRRGVRETVGDISGGIGQFLTRVGQTVVPGGERGFLGPREPAAETALTEPRAPPTRPSVTEGRGVAPYAPESTAIAPAEARPLDFGTPPLLSATRQASVRSRAQARARELEQQGRSREEILEIMNREGFHVVP